MGRMDNTNVLRIENNVRKTSIWTEALSFLFWSRFLFSVCTCVYLPFSQFVNNIVSNFIDPFLDWKKKKKITASGIIMLIYSSLFHIDNLS